MELKTVILAAAASISLAAPALALADPEGWRGGDAPDQGYRGQYRGYGDQGGRDWHDQQRDEHRGDWRDHEYWEHHGGWWGGDGWRWAYPRRCWVEYRGYYEPDGDYVSRPVRLCR